MIQALKINQLIITAIVSLAVAIGAYIALPSSASAQIDRNLESGSCLSLSGNSCGGVSSGGTRIENTIKTIVNIFSILVGIAAVIMIIMGGFRYITSGGESNNIASAKNTILYAIVGLIIVALAQAIVWFVLNET